MSGTGHLVLFVCLGLILIIGIFAIDQFRNSVNDMNESVQSQADMGITVSKPLFTTFGYLLVGLASVALINAFRSM